MRKVIKLSDIAEVHGVSVVTVSNALSGRKGVSETLRKNILSTADKMGYTNTSSDRTAARTFSVGILGRKRWFSVSDSFFWELYRNLVSAAASRDCLVVLDVLSDDDMSIPNSVRMNKVDGVILIGRQPDGYIDKLKAECPFPLVFLNFYEANTTVDTVVSSGYLGMYLMTKLLLEAGHRDIAYVGSLSASNSIADRYYGYLKALREHGIEECPDWCLPDRNTEGVIGVTLPARMPTAFACCTDLTAVHVINLLKERGLSVPEDISVVGFDGYLPGIYRDIVLTTYAVDIKQMAWRGLDVLIDKMANANFHVEMMTIPGRVLEGKTVRSIGPAVPTMSGE